ncbi:RagB/SusD family nutrient uptake outer membrane protein [Tenacibaculum ovolyticum]|uniref:RagB/SusD family nutrient uptake outer membrane protein n=1 Tax=Tenacibaculum ovolyticum TaxID=104270 RepID=UPI001F3B0F19|nr:RagB/SusD family nutrient uptake outer membrane protein [Tenacibaculum ovolyticum]
MKNNKKILLLLFLFSLSIISCDDFLDELPDNRTEIDNTAKIRKLLISAYPSTGEALVTELSSDNCQDAGALNYRWDRVHKELSYWEDVSTADNDGPNSVWEGCYAAIAAANEALAAINKIGGTSLNAEKGEALIARAYAHFVLINVFSQHYNEDSSTTDLGVPYLESPEVILNPKYKRGTVKEVYEKINRDIEAGLPLINNNIYSVPKYHFNVKAAHAFAARFNLYYQNWEKARDYASVVLTQNPSTVLRNWEDQGLVTSSQDPRTRAYISDGSSLLNITSGSNAGLIFGGGYSVFARFNHLSEIADTETLFAPQPWSPSVNSADYFYRPASYSSGSLNKVILMKLPYIFEYTDVVAGIGFRRTVYTPFTTDETLMVRAEANIMLNQYDKAIDDLNAWSKNFFRNKETTVAGVDAFYNAMAYSTEANPTQKKTLTPKFSISAGTQENMLHYTLQCRRISTIHEGFRWFDIKRYGMSIPRYIFDSGNKSTVDVLKINDPRKAIQIPAEVISAGLTPNPR